MNKRTDREPQPCDGPDYHADHAAWEERQRRREASPEERVHIALREHVYYPYQFGCRCGWKNTESTFGHGYHLEQEVAKAARADIAELTNVSDDHRHDAEEMRKDRDRAVARLDRVSALVDQWDQDSRHSLTDWHTPKIVQAIREAIA